MPISWQVQKADLSDSKTIMKNTHTIMSPALRRDIGIDPEYARCAAIGIPEHPFCGGRITRSHDAKCAGKKVQRRWAINPICALGHGVDEYQDAGTHIPERVRLWIALNRASDRELLEFPRANFIGQRELLNREFGKYVPPLIPIGLSINY